MTTHERRIIESVIAAYDAAVLSDSDEHSWADFCDRGGVEALRKLVDESKRFDDG